MPFLIFMAYCLMIDTYAFSIFDSNIFGSSKDYLENTDNTELSLFGYINNNTEIDDVVIISVYPVTLDANIVF